MLDASMDGDTAENVNSTTDATGYYRRYYNLRSAQGATTTTLAADLEQQARRKQLGPSPRAAVVATCAAEEQQQQQQHQQHDLQRALGHPRPPSSTSLLARVILSLALVGTLAVSLGVAGAYCSLRLVHKHLGDLSAALHGTTNDLMEVKRGNEEMLLKVYDHVNKVKESLQDEMGELIRREMWLRDNDKTGLVDFALESAGGRVLSTNDTPRYDAEDSTLSFLGFPLYQLTRSNPTAMLQPDMSPGACWAFRGARGLAVVSLLGFVHLTGVSLEHIPASQAPTGLTLSAPRDFALLALPGPYLDKHAVELGRFVYEVGGASLQTFRILVKPNRSYRYVALSVLSNHGHQDFTCVYRFRVHGTLDARGHLHRRIKHETGN